MGRVPTVVMTDLERMIRDVLLNPEDDTARLICADAFEETGQHARAAFIRWQLAGGKGPTLAWSRDWLPTSLCGLSWGASSNNHFIHAGGPYRSYITGSVELLYHRGFVREVAFNTFDTFKEHAAGLFATEPIRHAYLVDRHPDPYPGGWGWAKPRAGLARSTPWAIPRKLRDWPGWPNHAGHWWVYNQQTLAVADLSSALVWYGRTLAGLPALPPLPV